MRTNLFFDDTCKGMLDWGEIKYSRRSDMEELIVGYLLKGNMRMEITGIRKRPDC